MCEKQVCCSDSLILLYLEVCIEFAHIMVLGSRREWFYCFLPRKPSHRSAPNPRANSTCCPQRHCALGFVLTTWQLCFRMAKSFCAELIAASSANGADPRTTVFMYLAGHPPYNCYVAIQRVHLFIVASTLHGCVPSGHRIFVT